MSNPTTTPTSVELWIRSFAPASAGPTQERALEQLSDLESQAPIESVDVSVWGKEIEVDRPERAMQIPQLCRIERRLEAFENWAARTGRRLEPFFRNTHVESSITGESHDVWRLPTIAVAEFDGDELLHVAPVAMATGRSMSSIGSRRSSRTRSHRWPSTRDRATG